MQSMGVYHEEEEKERRSRKFPLSSLVCLLIGLVLGMGFSCPAGFGAGLYSSSSGIVVEEEKLSREELERLRSDLQECQARLRSDAPASASNDSASDSTGDASKHAFNRGKRTTIAIPPVVLTPAEKIKKLKTAVDVIQTAKNDILKRYGVSAEDAEKGLWGNSESREHMVKRLHATLAHPGGRFVLSFTGMSVCAGHGSYVNESYPNMVGTTLKKAFEAVGVRLVVRNQCMGGTYTFPYSWCLTNIAGNDVDVIAWDFGMMEAGRQFLTEGWLQQAMKMPSKPAVMMMAGYANNLLNDQTGGAVTDLKVPGVDVPRKTLLTTYARDAKLPAFGFWIAPILREKYTQRVIPEKQKGKGPGGWENCIELTPKDPSQSLPPLLKDLRWYSKKGLPGQASWHPAPREHRVVAELLSWSYLDMLKTATQREIVRLVDGTEPPPKKDDVTSSMGTVTDSRECEKHPEMFCQENWQCATSYEPREGGGLTEVIENDNYKKALAPADNTAIEEVIRFGTGYRDRKYAYRGQQQDGPLSFRLHHVKGGKVVVCEPTYGWRKPKNVADLATDVEFFLDARPLEIPEKWVKPMHDLAKNCILVLENCPKGGHDLTLRPMADDKSLYVSFVVWN